MRPGSLGEPTELGIVPSWNGARCRTPCRDGPVLRAGAPTRVMGLRSQLELAAQAAAETTWLAEAAGRDLVILTRDGNLYVNEHERLALERYRHRVFWIGPKKGTGQDWADTFEAHHRAIVRYARRPGPYVVKVQQRGLERAWP
jgi:hypothetical protein